MFDHKYAAVCSRKPRRERHRTVNLHAMERPILEYFRVKRIALFYELFEITRSVRVLDLGGTLFFWELAQRHGFAVPTITLVNLDKPKTPVPAYAEWLVCDALTLPFPDNRFDIVFSNSLIEHLGSWQKQVRFAAEVRRLAPRHFVQTPSRDFPFEPHLLTPFVHWLPKHIRVRMIRNGTLWGLLTRPTKQRCAELAEEIRLLDDDEMTQLFPKSELKVEKLLRIPKSLIAVKV
jgi:hypothetical protein